MLDSTVMVDSRADDSNQAHLKTDPLRRDNVIVYHNSCTSFVFIPSIIFAALHCFVYLALFLLFSAALWHQ